MVRARSRPVALIGQCIYCGAADRPLFEEHILAANMGGEETLKAACCADCEKVINKQVEQPCLRDAFQAFRYKHGIGSRRVAKRPKLLPASVRSTWIGHQTGDHPGLSPSEWNDQFVPYDKHLAPLVLPIFGYPKLICLPGQDIESRINFWSYIRPIKFNKEMDRPISVDLKCDSRVFKRFLGKIAHCQAVSHYGLNGFTPYLGKFILKGDDALAQQVVGCYPFSFAPELRPFSISVYEGSNKQKRLIICRIRLFSSFVSNFLNTAGNGSPVYLVVVGERH